MLVIQGARRCGKSTLLRQLIGRYQLEPSHCAFVNFEDPRLSNSLDWPVLEGLVEAFRARHPRVAELTFFLDEIQNVRGWERWLRSQLDRPRGNRFVITGSNASLLAGELGTALTGRHVSVELFPFDIEEFRIARPGASVADFLTAGGFPEPLTLTERDADHLRRQHFIDIVERDVRERLSARSSQPIRQVVQVAYEAAGSELSLRRVAAATGVAIETAGSYLAACESAYLLFSVPFFAYSERKRAGYHRKYYPVDTGMRRAVVTSGGLDLGKSLECAVFLALRRTGGEVYYWRGDGEVDFVVQSGRRLTPVQVSVSPMQPRHEKALRSFYESFPHAEEAIFVDPVAFETWQPADRWPT